MTTVNLVNPVEGIELDNSSSGTTIQAFTPGGYATGATMFLVVDGIETATPLTDFGGSGWQCSWDFSGVDLGAHTIAVVLHETGGDTTSATHNVTIIDGIGVTFEMPDVRNMTEAEARAAIIAAGAPLGYEPPLMIQLSTSSGIWGSDADYLGETGSGYAYADTIGPDGTVSYQGRGIGEVIHPLWGDTIYLDIWGVGEGMLSGPDVVDDVLTVSIDDWLGTLGHTASSFIPGWGVGGSSGETALIWDAPGTRRYETGVDRGVLYPPSGIAVAWNGLVGIAESVGREVKSYFVDGVKYLDHHVVGAYSAKLQAFTYPAELDVITGAKAFVPGLFVHDQRIRPFSLSYRTRIGNDIDGIDHAYQLHIVYNVIAAPSGNLAFATIGESIVPNVFEWTLTATPQSVSGARPTSHISFRSDAMASELLATIEARLYGTTDASPDFPTLDELLTLIQDYYDL